MQVNAHFSLQKFATYALRVLKTVKVVKNVDVNGEARAMRWTGTQEETVSMHKSKDQITRKRAEIKQQ
ncbi:unnamed protein product [Sphenostylis stenocarpa]|uniref:Uncharacterized protein n=1 Tax=Sphenostylis stenocarpa TaxID=92480 RepID=A0AA86S3E9_9FABA|nr:unnamed protein product [Sphenostylis stenocarpa]